MIERLEALCRAHGTNFSKLEKSLGFANGSIKKSDVGVIRADRVKKLADYFNVSMEYIMTGEAPASPSLSDVELRIVEAYRLADLGTQAAICKLLDVKGGAGSDAAERSAV